jgi:hypothetical protein
LLIEIILSLNRFSEEEVQAKVDAYRCKLMGGKHNENDATAKDEHGRPM